MKIKLLGTYQPRNASVVLKSVDTLHTIGLDISDEALSAGLIEAEWRGRFEIIDRSPLTIFDGAHNPEGISSATESIKHYFGKEKVIVVSGVLKDKDYNFIAEKLARVASSAYTITPDNPRALAAESFAELLSSKGVAATPNKTIFSALSGAMERAEKTGEAIVCLGSLYTYVDVTAELEKLL
jgi:dihydrofolate synthase/folylpolyglutamate synthase